MVDPLLRLEQWYSSRCNDDWEHQYGVEIKSLDNPGWAIEVDLAGTILCEKDFADIRVDRSESDWVQCRVRNDKFQGFGGPRNLKELIEKFLEWGEDRKDTP